MRWLGTSWKMTKTLAESRAWVAEVLAGLAERGWDGGAPVRTFVIPSFTATAAVGAQLGPGSPLLLGVQNAHWADAGAWTGEISIPQAADAGAGLVEIGHSERRAAFGETIETTRLKVRATVGHGLVPLLCVGEPEAVRAAGGSAAYVLEQAEGALSGLSPEQLGSVVVAYEPVWAIGDAGREANPEELMAAFAALNEGLGSRVGAILYGGSVNRSNARGLLDIPGVDGLFVGRAAWDAAGYLDLLDIAAADASGGGARSQRTT